MLETDPRDLALDKQNDLIFENGDFQFTYGLDGIIQEARIKLQMFEGEWFLNLEAGIPYWNEILGQKPDVAIPAIAAHFNQTLLGIEDVTDVTKMSVAYNGKTRQLVVRWAVRSLFGNTPTDTLAI